MVNRYHIPEPVWAQVGQIHERLGVLKGERSQRAWARELDVPQPTLQMYMGSVNGLKRMPPLEFFIHLARRENVNLNWLLVGEGEPYREMG